MRIGEISGLVVHRTRLAVVEHHMDTVEFRLATTDRAAAEFCERVDCHGF